MLFCPIFFRNCKELPSLQIVSLQKVFCHGERLQLCQLISIYWAFVLLQSRKMLMK